MPKKRVRVTLSWFSSLPVFEEVRDAVSREMELKELPPLNGETRHGPHTHVWFEAPSLASALRLARTLEYFLKRAFPEGVGAGTGGIHVLFAGKPLPELLEDIEVALCEATGDLKKTRRFLPSKNLQRLRVVTEQLYS